MKFTFKILFGLVLFCNTINSQIFENFEAAGTWTWAPWQLGFAGTLGVKTASAAHNGNFGLSQAVAGQPWHYRTDVSTGTAGNVLGGWARGDQRNYLGFGASLTGGWSIVLAPNTNQLIIQRNASWGYSDLVATPIVINTAQWYFLELTYNTASNVTGRLYNASMVFQASVNVSPVGLTPGGVSMRIYTSGTGWFDEFSLNTILPIELLEFKGEQNETTKTTILNWTTATEKNNNYFSIERSIDGKNFESIGTIDSKGNSNIIKEYTFVDSNPFKGINYYQLRQVDFDGKATPSKIIDVNIINPNYISTQVFPTVSTGIFNLQLPNNGEHVVNVSNLAGQVVQSVNVTSQNNSVMEINLSNLAAGCYLISGYDNNHNWNKKIFVAK